MSAINERKDLRIFPEPVVKKMKRRFLLVWLIPILAAIAASVYFREYFAARGARVTVELDQADGVKVSDTLVMHRGVKLGQVSGIELSQDHRHVLVHIRLEERYGEFAKSGASYWIVRPQISTTAGLSGLNTVFTGPYIEARPGSGKNESKFLGLDQAPEAPIRGISLVLSASKVEHIQNGSPIYYRGIQVGSIRNIDLASMANHVDIHIEIWPRFEKLVTTQSHFWMVTGIDVSGGIFTGLSLKLESLPTLVNGAIAFATPQVNPGAAVKPGAHFALEKEAKKEWLEWAPKIPIG